MCIRDRYWKDQSTAMGKSDEMAKSFDDCINLSLGDPDLITDRLIIDSTTAAETARSLSHLTILRPVILRNTLLS